MMLRRLHLSEIPWSSTMRRSLTTDAIALQMLALQQESPLLVALFDATDQLHFANPAFRQGYGLASDEQISWPDLMRKNHAQGVGAFIQTTDIEDWLASVRSRRGKVPFRAFEADLCDGRWIWMTETVGADGWMLNIGSDITELKASGRVLRQARDVALRAAQTDALTGLSNRAHIMQQLTHRLEQQRLQQQPCGIALLDLDHFKRINDRYGHPGGDAVLKDFARTVLATLRREDALGRVGGEEFMLLFPGITVDEMNRILPRILALVRESRPMPGQTRFSYTCSAGVGMLTAEDDAATVIARVDQALYAAKAAGRDCFKWAKP